MGPINGLKFTNEHKISTIFISGTKDNPIISYTKNIQLKKKMICSIGILLLMISNNFLANEQSIY